MRETTYPVRGCPFTIALLSDLHDSPFDRIAGSLSRHRPDIICVPGDFVNAKKRPAQDVAANAAHILPFFRMCAGIAPTFVSLGNHEWMLTPEDLACIRSTGVIVLENRFVHFETAVIGGLSSSLYTGYQRDIVQTGQQEQYPYPRAAGITAAMPPETDWLEDFSVQPGFRLLLCHHPEYYPLYLQTLELSLVLSGHAHGGQIRLFCRGLYAPGQGVFPRLTEGVHYRCLAISRGLSNTSLVPRLWNPPEIVYITQNE